MVATKECMVHNGMAPRFYPWQHRFESRVYLHYMAMQIDRHAYGPAKSTGPALPSNPGRTRNGECLRSRAESGRDRGKLPTNSLGAKEPPKELWDCGKSECDHILDCDKRSQYMGLQPDAEKERKSDDEGYDDVLVVCGSSFIINYEDSWSNKIEPATSSLQSLSVPSLRFVQVCAIRDCAVDVQYMDMICWSSRMNNHDDNDTVTACCCCCYRKRTIYVSFCTTGDPKT